MWTSSTLIFYFINSVDNHIQIGKQVRTRLLKTKDSANYTSIIIKIDIEYGNNY